MNQHKNNGFVEIAKAAALASKTPFWTAFKVTMGIGFAQLIMGAIVFGCFIGLLGLIGYLIK